MYYSKNYSNNRAQTVNIPHNYSGNTFRVLDETDRTYRKDFDEAKDENSDADRRFSGGFGEREGVLRDLKGEEERPREQYSVYGNECARRERDLEHSCDCDSDFDRKHNCDCDSDRNRDCDCERDCERDCKCEKCSSPSLSSVLPKSLCQDNSPLSKLLNNISVEDVLLLGIMLVIYTDNPSDPTLVLLLVLLLAK
ncbi:MAG: hypothetical protein ACI3XL_00585 [Eubacteriales bacterium]